MPHTTYGLLKAIRSHQIDSPSVAASLRTGRPNACNLCHLDRTLGWTGQHLSAWYGQAKPPLSHQEETVAASLLWLLKGEAGQRALIAWSMGWTPAQETSGTGWMPPFLAILLEDPYDAVRFIAHRSLSRIDGFEGFPYDFVRAAEEPGRARDRVMDRWRGLVSGANEMISPQLLFEEKARLDHDKVLQLLAERDQRPVNLKE